MSNISFPDNTLLRGVPAPAIVSAIADAARRWCDADFPPRVRVTSAIEKRTGYATPVVEYALDRLFGGITADALRAAILDELGSFEVLDRFVATGGRPPRWARGVDHAVIVASDTTIGVAIPPLCYALCAKCAVYVKDRSDALAAAFVETLGQECPELARAVRVDQWTGGVDSAFERYVFRQAATVVAFGGDESLRAIRAKCGIDTTFVPFGHRNSAAFVTRNDLLDDVRDLAAAIARDTLLYDGEGCLSLHLLFVERPAGGDLERFLDALRRSFAATALEFPPGVGDPERAALMRSVRSTMAFRESTGDGRMVYEGDSAWFIMLDLPRQELPMFGHTALPLIQVDGLEDAACWLDEHHLGPLEAVGINDPALDPRHVAATFDAVRVTRLGRMQDPPLAGHHGGRPRIADFVRWLDYEP